MREALVLLNAGMPGGAYQMAGLAIELALKVCVAAQFRSDEVPDWATTRDFKTHDFEKLVTLANLSDALEEAKDLSATFRANWEIVREWRIDHRYSPDVTTSEAAQLVRAVDGEDHGVLGWIRAHW